MRVFQMIKLQLLFFGVAKDIVGEREISLALQDNVNIRDLKNILYSQYIDLAEYDSCLFAVNESYEQEDYHLHDGDVVALIPPVSGG